MKKNTSYLITGSCILVMLIAVLVTGLIRHDFRLSSSQSLERALTGNQFISPAEILKKDPATVVIVQLDSMPVPPGLQAFEHTRLPGTQNLSRDPLFSSGKEIILLAASRALASKTWFWLVQNGQKKLYILDEDSIPSGKHSSDEWLRYPFQRDTTGMDL